MPRHAEHARQRGGPDEQDEQPAGLEDLLQTLAG